MTLSTSRMRARLQAFDFKKLFVYELGWKDHNSQILPFEFGGVQFKFTSVAEQGGMLVLTCTASDGNIPSSGARTKIDHFISGLYFEHLIIFTDQDAQSSLWLWVKREDGKVKPRTFTYRRGMMGDALLQKLAGIAFEIEELDAEGQISIATVTGRVKKAFDVETVTKKFYEQFKTEHTAFLGFLKGIPESAPRDWYASVMLNRLMFLYFIQKKRFLNDDPDYLRTRLEETRSADKNFYRDFLRTLFFQGLACEEGERDAATNKLLGKVPYLNGGLFLPHPIEDRYGSQITVADAAFERLFNFFDSYTWHLDERPLRQGNEINPDVLGYIFEKYINQKQMGAYYTKEDITGYICRSTILPFLLDKCGVDVRAILTDVEPYIYDAVKTDEYLPTETEREYAARRKRYAQIRADFAEDKIASVNDLVTYNLDIQTLVEDWLGGLSDPVVLRRFYFECLSQLTVLDPTCGSGAFLFAAINILEPIYELALDKMRRVVGAPESTPSRPAEQVNVVKYLDFVDELKRVDAHPNPRYFVLKSIIVNNLYGVDIMDEAVEICKLRLFLKMVAQVEDVSRIEPLPDIDFNIRSGNTLVGFATREEIQSPTQVGFRSANMADLMRQVDESDRKMRTFRDLQTRLDIPAKVFKASKENIQDHLEAIRQQLNQALLSDYGQEDTMDLATFCASHKPFHWYVEFNSVLANGGFDVIVGNPPYVEYAEVKKKAKYEIRGYETERTGNLYAFVTERVLIILHRDGWLGVIIPVASVCTDGYMPLQKLLRVSGELIISNYNDRPSKLFDGLEHIRLSIIIQHKDGTNRAYTTKYNRWQAVERETLFESLNYTETTEFVRDGSIPKLSSVIERSILSKIFRQTKTLQYYERKTGRYKIYYTRKLGGFVQILDFIPEMYDGARKRRNPSELKEVPFQDDSTKDVFLCLLNSSLFYWFMTIYSDCRNLNKREVYGFPLNVEQMTSMALAELSRLAARLMDDFRGNSHMLQLNYKIWGQMSVQAIYPRLSKPIIDEIDRVLARHYGFTDDELDFIIHYDIKYRMGKDAEGEGEEE